jgi:hypothetical protein
MHFALVHGAYHGAWCWDMLRTELKRDGHSTSAVDLPCEDPEAGAECYAELVVRAIPPGTAAVLVGHSPGGLTIPVVASRTPTLVTVYLLCTDDRMVSSEYSRRSSQKLLGFEPVEIRGGHSPFLAHPRELATLLERVSSGAPEGTPG